MDIITAEEVSRSLHTPEESKIRLFNEMVKSEIDFCKLPNNKDRKFNLTIKRSTLDADVIYDIRKAGYVVEDAFDSDFIIVSLPK